MTLLNKTLTTIGLTSIVIGSLAHGAQAGPICTGLIARDNQVRTQFIQQAEQAAVAGNWNVVLEASRQDDLYATRTEGRLVSNGCLSVDGHWTHKVPSRMADYSSNIEERWEILGERLQADVALAAVAAVAEALTYIF